MAALRRREDAAAPMASFSDMGYPGRHGRTRRVNRRVRLTFSGETPQARAEALARAAELSRGEGDADVSEPAHEVRLRVIVTGAADAQGFAAGVAYAAGEVRAGVAVAGGHVGGGVHVELQWLNGPFPAED